VLSTLGARWLVRPPQFHPSCTLLRRFQTSVVLPDVASCQAGLRRKNKVKQNGHIWSATWRTQSAQRLPLTAYSLADPAQSWSRDKVVIPRSAFRRFDICLQDHALPEVEVDHPRRALLTTASSPSRYGVYKSRCIHVSSSPHQHYNFLTTTQLSLNFPPPTTTLSHNGPNQANCPKVHRW
jgi:hypothetical protein